MLRIWTAGLLIAAALATPAWAQSNRSSAPPKPPFPVLELPEKARGQRAIDLLGGRLPELAAWYGKSPAEFAAILRRDRNLQQLCFVIIAVGFAAHELHRFARQCTSDKHFLAIDCCNATAVVGSGFYRRRLRRSLFLSTHQEIATWPRPRETRSGEADPCSLMWYARVRIRDQDQPDPDCRA